MDVLEVGEISTLTGHFYDADGTPTDPSGITLTITSPDGTVTDYVGGVDLALTNPAVGVWTLDLVVTAAGVWTYRFTGTGAVVAGETRYLLVQATGEPAENGPCDDWCCAADLEACPAGQQDLNSDAVPIAITLASRLLFQLSGARYPGLCRATRAFCVECRCSLTPCRCRNRDARDLDLGSKWDAYGILSVVVDGATLSPADYTIDDWRWLRRTDGSSWASGGDDPTTWPSVTWVYGALVPEDAKRAAAILAAEIAAACTDGAACGLPARYRTITGANREGTSYTIIDSMKMIDEGRTGIYLVDLWLNADRVGREASPGIFAPAAHGPVASALGTG